MLLDYVFPIILPHWLRSIRGSPCLSDCQVLLLGTNHKSYYSMEQTQTLIQEASPEAVFVEVCAERQENLLKRLAMRCR